MDESLEVFARQLAKNAEKQLSLLQLRSRPITPLNSEAQTLATKSSSGTGLQNLISGLSFYDWMFPAESFEQATEQVTTL